MFFFIIIEKLILDYITVGTVLDIPFFKTSVLIVQESYVCKDLFCSGGINLLYHCELLVLVGITNT